MAIDSVGASPAIAQSTPRTGLDQQDFIRLFMTQLSYQDPLDPMDNREFLAQLVQFSSLDQNQRINESLESLLSAQSATQSVGLIGKQVVAAQDGGASVEGVVTTVEFQEGRAQLTLQTADGSVVPGIGLGQITTVRN